MQTESKKSIQCFVELKKQSTFTLPHPPWYKHTLGSYPRVSTVVLAIQFLGNRATRHRTQLEEEWKTGDTNNTLLMLSFFCHTPKYWRVWRWTTGVVCIRYLTVVHQ